MFTIRKATPEDISEIKDLNFKLFEQDFSWDDTLDMGWTFRDSTHKLLIDELQSDHWSWVVGSKGEKIVGYMAFSIIETPVWMDKNLKIAELEHTYVAAEFRRMGLGEEMFADCEKWAKSKGCNLLTVTASYKNQNAQLFYESNGFIKTDVTLQKKI